MGRLLSRFGISIQVGVIGAIALLGFTLLGMLYLASFYQQSAAQAQLALAVTNRLATNQIIIDLLQLSREEKNFLLRRDDSYAANHAKGVAEVTDKMKHLTTDLTPDDATALQSIGDGFAAYAAAFKVVVAQADTNGLTENVGLRGMLRSAVHDIEKDVNTFADAKLMISMLMMRRHEKDFMERQDAKYVAELRQEAATFKSLLPGSALSPDAVAVVRDRLAKYLQGFEQLAAATLQQQDNLKKAATTFQAIQPQIDALRDAIAHRAEVQILDNTATQTMLNRVAFLGLACIGLAVVLVGWLIGRHIAQPVRAMTAAMQALAAGDTAIEIPGGGRRDEIGAMAAAMVVFRDNMIKADRLTKAQLAERAVKERRQAAMAQHTQDFGTSISGVMVSLVGAAGGMRQSADAMAHAASTVHDQASETATGASDSSRELTTVAAAIEEMTVSIDEIARQVTAAADVARDAVNEAETGQASIKELAEATARIGDVVGLISTIAGQTNLLALNATIEAARAGEAGRGFAVVAGEVKALAAQTARATNEISTQINAIQSTSRNAIAAVEQIATVIGKMEHVSSAIASAVEEQSVTTRGIAGSVQAVTGAVESAARAMATVVDNADQAGQVSQDVQTGADEIGRQASKLRVEVDQFLQAVRTDTGERRQYERLDANGMMVKLQVRGQSPEQVMAGDISRGGMSVKCQGQVPAGTEVEVKAPGGDTVLRGRVVRKTPDGFLGIVFIQDSATIERVDQILQGLQIKRAA